MPELPDLTVVEEYLQRNIVGQSILEAEMTRPTVLRDLTGEGLEALVGRRFTQVDRRGKFLILSLSACTLQGDGKEFRYTDARSLGRFYITNNLDAVTSLKDLGPDALDPDLNSGAFRQRLKRRRTDIKKVLRKQGFVAGIGNAYADEILFRAGIYPFRKCPALSDEEIEPLYRAMRGVLTGAIEVLRERMGEEIGREEEIRDFLQVHRKGG